VDKLCPSQPDGIERLPYCLSNILNLIGPDFQNTPDTSKNSAVAASRIRQPSSAIRQAETFIGLD
jgi:hypothetical protein